ncbi:MAG: FAD:protein FMN transferase, partial [Deltaproteobacteria bacterium]|nr:FAD:protein FMN transferase [Deltaproteobacteria bacterium]
DLLKILMKAREISELTEGAFDITFLSKEPSDYSNVFLAPELSLAALRTPKTQIGVSGIAKGYIVDRMSEVLRKAGFKKFLVNAGDLYAAGPWKIGIRNPEGGKGATLCTLLVHNRAVSTSGLYERGRHIIDPTTHKPVTRLKSVTVIADSSILADALGTGAFVMGKDKIPLLAKKIPNISILFVDNQGVRGAVGKVSECLP